MSADIVLRHAFAVGVHQAEAELRAAVPLIGGLAIPDEGLRVVLRHALALGVHQAEAELREGVPLLGQRTQNLQFRRVVAFLIGGLGVLKRSRPCYATARTRERCWQRELRYAASRCAASGTFTRNQYTRIFL